MRHASVPLAIPLVATLLAGVSCRDAGPGARDTRADHAGHDDHAGRADNEGHARSDADEGREDHGGHEAEGIIELRPEAARSAQLRTERVDHRAWLGGIQTTGEVHFDSTRLAHVSPRLEGRIHRVDVAVGDRVERDQPIAVLDSVELGKAKAEYLSAQARLELAQGTLDREEGLLERRISSEQQVIEARAAREEAAAMLRAATDTLRVLGLSEREIDRTRHGDPASPLLTVRAPFAGKLVELHATRGELVGPETDLATVADLSQLWVWVDVYETDVARVKEGDRATVRLDAFPGEPIHGVLALVRDQVDRDARTVRARVDIPNPDERIKPGMFARVLLEQQAGSEGGARTIVVPAGAVQRDRDEQVAFVRTGADRYERRELRVGRRAAGLVEVLAGLSAGDEVVVEGGFILKSELGKSEMGEGHSH